MHTFSHIHFPTYIFPHTYTFFTYIFHIQMYVCDPKFHTYIHFGKKMYVPHTYVYVCKMFTDTCSHTLVCTALVTKASRGRSSRRGLGATPTELRTCNVQVSTKLENLKSLFGLALLKPPLPDPLKTPPFFSQWAKLENFFADASGTGKTPRARRPRK
jgi:hypothetical protein